MPITRFNGLLDFGNQQLSVLPGGSHADVIMSGGKVVKLIADKKRPLTEVSANDFMRAMIRYDEMLRGIGLKTPCPMEIKVNQNSDSGIWTIVQVAPYVGKDLARIMRAEESAAFGATVDQLVAVLRPVLFAIAGGRRLGIDPKPANFTRGEDGSIYYVDLFPPRYVEDAGAYVEYPEPITSAGQRIAYFRHFNIAGILLVLMSQLTRLRPELRVKAIKPKILALADELSVGQHFRESLAEQFLQADEAARWDIVNNLAEVNMYDIREIAGELVAASDGLYSAEQLDHVFHLSHFVDGLADGALDRLRVILVKIMQRLPFEMAK